MGHDLSGRAAVVTGGGRGIGWHIAHDLAGAGARVLICGRSESVLKEASDSLRAAGGDVGFCVCDVAKIDDVARLKETVGRTLGPVTILVNNAGVARSAKFPDTDEAMWQSILDVNLTGAYRTTRAFWADLVAAGTRGRLINIASVAAKIGFLYSSAYCASKHGLLGLTRALAAELAKNGPTANCVCPGWVETAMGQRAVDNIAKATGAAAATARGQLENMSPQKRLMTPEEVSQLTLYLASDAARGVTGQAWNVDGGAVMY